MCRVATDQGSQGKVREFKAGQGSQGNQYKDAKKSKKFKANQFFSFLSDFCCGRSNCVKSGKLVIWPGVGQGNPH